jgi:sulfite reductase (NADPH) hemoprotein beta-component
MKPKIVTANRLSDGAVVYLDAAGDWVEAIAAAGVATDEETAEALLAVASTEEQSLRVVGPYLMDVALDGDRPRPLGTREILRAQGPTVAGAAILEDGAADDGKEASAA